MQISDRYNTVKSLRLCFNCLSTDHSCRDCKVQPCTCCEYKHNFLLHGLPYQAKRSSSSLTNTDTKTSNIGQQVPNNLSEPSTSTANIPGFTTLNNVDASSQVLLSTAIVLVQDCLGRNHPCRALLDNGSQINIVSQRMIKRLNLEISRATLPICGVNEVSTNSTQWVNINLLTYHSQYKKIIGCHILPSITVPLPVQSINITNWKFPDNIKNSLTDSGFHISSNIDLLLGAEVFFDIILL